MPGTSGGALVRTSRAADADNGSLRNAALLLAGLTVAAAGVTYGAVSDHGPGIAQEDLPYIFERFYRAPDARGMPGAGLGLAIVGSVAQADKGTVEVRTGPGGPTFTLAFPPLRNAGEYSADQQD